MRTVLLPAAIAACLAGCSRGADTASCGLTCGDGARLAVALTPAWSKPDVGPVSKRQLGENTVWTRGGVLRVHESAEDMYVAIDAAAHKLERQAARYRERRRKGMRSVRVALQVTEIEALIESGYLECELRDDPAALKAAVEMVVGDLAPGNEP